MVAQRYDDDSPLRLGSSIKTSPPIAGTTAKTMTVRFTRGIEKTIPRGTIYTDTVNGWTTVTDARGEVVLRAPSELIESFGISVEG